MKLRLSSRALLVGSLLVAGQALADCPGPFLHEMQATYTKARAAESQGRQEAALYGYSNVRGDVCEGKNPYEADSVKRAAAIGLALGTAAEKKGDWKNAFDLYNAGGHYARADQALMVLTRADADNTRTFGTARGHFDERLNESFASNNASVIRVTGAYRPDAKFLAELTAMANKGYERAAQREATAFNEQFLREFVQYVQSRPDDLLAPGSMQQFTSSTEAFAKKWKNMDPLEQSQEELETMRRWGSVSGDSRLEQQAEAAFNQRADQHSQVIAAKYAGSPGLLKHSIDYVHMLRGDEAKRESRIAALKAQAGRLGDEAAAKKRLQLASEYYSVAGNSEKAEAMRDQQQKLAMQKMQPSIDQAQRQADEMRKQFGDPEKVKEMQAQAEAIRKRMQAQQAQRASGKEANQKRADDLEKELGL